MCRKVNNFIEDHGNARGEDLLGCKWYAQNNKLCAYCENPFKKDGGVRTAHIGYYTTELEAHLAWKKRKHKYATELANSKYVTDVKVKQVLLTKYQNYNIVEDHLK